MFEVLHKRLKLRQYVQFQFFFLFSLFAVMFDAIIFFTDSLNFCMGCAPLSFIPNKKNNSFNLCKNLNFENSCFECFDHKSINEFYATLIHFHVVLVMILLLSLIIVA